MIDLKARQGAGGGVRGGVWFAFYKLGGNVKQYDQPLWHFELNPALKMP